MYFFEEMCGVSDNVEEKIEWMYKNNVRIALLVWNESNALADVGFNKIEISDIAYYNDYNFLKEQL